ncbi:MAG: hypothetical protein ACR2FO_03065 [Actinomycetota bacterium]
MKTSLILAHGSTWSGNDWLYLTAPLAIYSACVLALLGFGRTEEPNLFKFFCRQISDSLERLTGFAGWAMAGVLTGLLFLLIAVTGFYWDVAEHFDVGRDTNLFTPSHIMILVGLSGIAFAGFVATIFATVDKAAVGFSAFCIRIPWSAATVTLMGVGSLAAFPVDALWHNAYGLDVTLWSPPHLQLVGGGSFATIGLILMIAEGRLKTLPTAWGKTVLILAAGAGLTGMTTFEGEFDFGAPQFQLALLPVLIMAAAGFTLVLTRMALGPGGAIKTVMFYLFLRVGLGLAVDAGLGHTYPRFPLYLASALAVEGAALWAGTDRRLRFGLIAGALVGTVGLIGELAWVTLSGWGTSSPALLPKIAILAPIAALASAVIGAGLAKPFGKPTDSVPLAGLVLAGLILLGSFAVLLPRGVGNVDAVISLEKVGERAKVQVQLDPPDAADGAIAFGINSWQGGGTVDASLRKVGPGRYVSSRTVPITGQWKTTVSLLRGNEIMAAPIYMAADPGITGDRAFFFGTIRKAEAIAALPERRVSFVKNTDLLMREAHEGPAWPAIVVWSVWIALLVIWGTLLALTSKKIVRPGDSDGSADAPALTSPDQKAAPLPWSPASWPSG